MATEERARGSLALVGLGLGDERGITLRGLEEARGADVVFAEFYTSSLAEGSIERLGSMIGKEIPVLDRQAVEDGTRILDECRGRKVVLLVAGDPMTATTHVDLRIRAEMASVRTMVVHGPSVLTSVAGLLGLQHYKFGRTTTLPFPKEGYSPTSPYEVIAENHSRGLHTLVLLDIDSERGAYMTANQGLRLLKDMEAKVGKGLVSENMLVAVVARAGSEDCVVRSGGLGEMAEAEFGAPLHTIVVPGRLHFMEEEALRLFAPSP